MRRVPLLALAFSAARFLPAAAPDAQTILGRVQKAYTDLKSYRIEASILIETTGEGYEQTLQSNLSIAAEPPAKYRIEGKAPGGLTLLSDGTQSWSYNTYLKQFTKTSPPATLSTALSTGAGPFLLPQRRQSVPPAKVTGEDTLTIKGAAHRCYVIQTEHEEQPSRFWVDQSTYLVLKRISEIHTGKSGGATAVRTTATVVALIVNEPLAPDFFAFVPPAGAKEVEKFNYSPAPKTSSLVSKPAPDFRLRDLDDKEWSLTNLRGKAVLLDFWATWCAPCRAEMPAIEQMHKDHPELIVLGIDVGEDLEVVRKFVAENKITYPILLAGRDRVSDDFDAHSLPTVAVIDAMGVIRTHQTGYGPETEVQLRAAIQDAAKPQVAAAEVSTASQNGRGVFRVGAGVSAPSVVSKADPEYTEQARNARLSGTVLLSLVVGVDGAAHDIKVIRPLGSGLDEKAIEAVRQWRFNPGRKNDEPVPVQATIEVNFRLMSDSPAAPATAAEAYRRGIRLIRTQRIAEGIFMFDRAIALDPAFPDPFAARARAHVQQRRYSEAIDDFSEALRLNPKNASWYDARGFAYAGFGRQSRAIEDYSRAIALSPNAPSAYYINRGWALLQTGDPAKAIEDLSTAIRLTPDNGAAFQYRGDAYAKQKDWQLAIADYTAAIELNPSRFIYERRAEAKKNSGDAAGADEDRKQASELAGAGPPRSPSALVPIPPGGPADPSLVAPKLMSPNEGAVFDLYPRHLALTWEAAPGAASYLLEWDYFSGGGWNSELKQLPGYGQPVNGLTASINFAGAQPGRWRVWPVNGKGQRGTASEWRTFRFTR